MISNKLEKGCFMIGYNGMFRLLGNLSHNLRFFEGILVIDNQTSFKPTYNTEWSPDGFLGAVRLPLTQKREFVKKMYLEYEEILNLLTNANIV